MSAQANSTPLTHPEGHGGHAHVSDPIGDKLGMWLFLYTELLLFGGMFILYSTYLGKFHHDFAEQSQHLDRKLGCLNTVFLLTSSLTMALSIAYLQRGKKALCLGLLGATLAFALAFFVVKYIEYHHKHELGIWPGTESWLELPHGEVIFYSLYFLMTGLHGLHVLIGAVLIVICMFFVQSGRISQHNVIFLENSGLYWHLVDLIWIFLFPLFYLIVL